MIDAHWLYLLLGAMFAAVAVASARDRTNPRRFGNAGFWGLIAVSFWFGDRIGDLANGALVLALVGLAGTRLIGRGSAEITTPGERAASSRRFGNRLFLPALIIPAAAFAGTILFSYTPLSNSGLIDPKAVTLVLLGAGTLIALAVCLAWFRAPLTAPVEEGRRLLDAIGWAVVLPQMLAALGTVFAAAGVGSAVGAIAAHLLSPGSIFLAVLVYALGMALFTIIMGNAFAAFPVMAAAIGIPVLVQADGGNPAVIGAVGMLAGFCGTLLTPMAANYNIVPVALLNLRNQYAVIRAQVGTALPLLAFNIAMLYFAGFR
ncbi:MAG: DUF979 domain-containing protein [Sphingomicrobium sp.]|nr:DUF979 domain-containing protein [Sphingomonadales bacterium]